jgi:hypothetical protein
MADAARAFLDALEPAQRAAAAWPFPSEDERTRWFYTPTDHGGLPLGAMRPRQQQLAHRLLASGLSRAGYVTAAAIMGLENVLDELEGWGARFGDERGRDPGRYFVRVFGSPSDGGAWAWRVGGHHLSVHYTVAGGEVASTTPCFFGAHPASSPLLGPHPLRPLAGAEDIARELVRSLDESQASRAVLAPVPPADLVGGNRPFLRDGDLPLGLPDIWRERIDAMQAVQDALEEQLGLTAGHLEAVRFTTTPKGLPAAAMDDAQREILRALLGVYVDRLPDEIACAQAARYEGSLLDGFHFAWAGGTEFRQPHYYRVHGGDVVVEYDNAQREANHVHSVWRDLANDFGAAAL